MTASSPPTRRVVSVIELLCERAGTATRLSDVVHKLGLNQATAYAILGELVESGWVSRDPADKTFTIGARLAGLTAGIDPASAITRAARAAAVTAATATGYASSVSERVGDSLVIAAFIAGAHDQWSAAPGDRLPFAAPFGPAYAAWELAAERHAWIDRSGVKSPAFGTRLQAHLDETRRQGFSVERMNPEMASAIPVMINLQHEALSDSMQDHLNEIILEIMGTTSHSMRSTPRRQQYVGVIAAPILNQLGRATHNICVHPFTALSARRIEQIGRDLRQAASEIEVPAADSRLKPRPPGRGC